MKILKQSLGFILPGLMVLLASAPVAAEEIPQLPARYWGTVTIYSGAQGINAPVGTVISVRVDGVEQGRIVTTERGRYGGATALDRKLTVQGDIAQGSLVEFYISGFKASQSVPFQNDHPQEVNLTLWLPVTVRGDANMDGSIDAVDITGVERVIVSLIPRTFGADVNWDGEVNALDITKLERIIARVD